MRDAPLGLDALDMDVNDMREAPGTKHLNL